MCDVEKTNDFRARHGTQLTTSFRHERASFGRLIAKIGYGHILTQLDPPDLDPIVLPFILGSETNLSNVVGCNDETEPLLEGIPCRGCIRNRADRLLAYRQTATYLAVVGKTRVVSRRVV